MSSSEKDKLMEEYVKRFFIINRIVEASGFCRFVIRKGKIVARSWYSILYTILVAIAADLSGSAIFWDSSSSHEELSTAEMITVLLFSVYTNLLLLQITFFDNYGGLDSIQNCIEIDCFLGAKETEFMRKLEINLYKTLTVLICFIQLGVVSYVYYLFSVSYFIHFFGSLYIIWVFFCYYDFCFCLYSFLFLTCRVRYINLALLKINNMKIEYIPKQSLFYKFFWWDEYDDRVTFHRRAVSKDFITALKMLFQQLRHLERSYKYPISSGLFTAINGTFVTVQTFVLYSQDSTNLKRAAGITSWAISTWVFIIIFTLLVDMFQKQTDQTKLICAYVQLKPSSTVEMLKLTKNILAMFEVRDARISLYNVFFMDTGLVVKLAASTFVYITLQLQVAFSNLEDGHKVNNVTKPTSFDLDRNRIKELLLIY